MGRNEIERVIRKVLVDEEGVCMREKVRELMGSAKVTLSEGGSSFNSFHKLAENLKLI